MTELILGSQSPRRKEILQFFSLPFRTESPTFSESSLPFANDPIYHAKQLSFEKAKSLSHLKEPVLCADTIVYQNGQLFEKPNDLQEALGMIRKFNGSWHSVYTAITLHYQNQYFTSFQETQVLFHRLAENQLERYLMVVSPLDKAGGYAIQGAGSMIIKEIRGCFYNVMGLGLFSLETVLNQVGICLWDFLKP